MACRQSMEIPHAVILPFPVQGHIKPMFILAELLSHAGFKVTFVNTHHNHNRFIGLIDEAAFRSRFPSFNFKSITDGLPFDHPRSGPSLFDLFHSTSTACAPEFKDLLISISEENGKWEPPTCIIADGIMSFAIDVAEELLVPVFTFRTYSATCTWVYFHLQKLIQIGEIPVPGDGDMDRQVTCIPELETILRRRDLPTICRLEVENPVLQFFLGQTSKMTRVSALILNTFEELEPPMVSQLHSIFPKIYTIGPLNALLKSRSMDSPLSSQSQPSNGSLRQQDRTCMTWLDSQSSKSVIFVSFGSVVVLTGDQLIEFWHGLINSEKPFLWVIRPDLVYEEKNQQCGIPFPEELALAVGTTNGRGCIVGWAPQEEVLAHKAIGGFLTHSGWNSTLESIWAGVPMICWPQNSDQHVNSRCASEIWRIGLDMKDTCHRSTVEKMVRELMEGKREEILKSMAKISRKANDSISKDGSSYRDIEKLIEDIRSIKSDKCAFEINNNNK